MVDVIKSALSKLFPPDFKGYAVELGACDGLFLSNTLHLEESGWDVLCIEANPEFYEKLKINRKITQNIAAGLFYEGNTTRFFVKPEAMASYSSPRPVCDLSAMKEVEVPASTLDRCLHSVKFPRLDFLSLDVEGYEPPVILGANLPFWKPKVIIAENTFPIGMTIDGFRDLLSRFGYDFQERLTDDDDLFVRRSDG